MFQVLSCTLMTPPGFKYFTAEKRDCCEKTLTLKASSLTEHLKARSCDRHVWGQVTCWPEGHGGEGPNPEMFLESWSHMIHIWFSRAYLRLNLYFCVFLACLFVCGLRDRRSHIFISVPVAVWRWKYARISPFSPAAFCIRVTFPGTGSGSMAVIYVSALGGGEGQD